MERVWRVWRVWRVLEDCQEIGTGVELELGLYWTRAWRAAGPEIGEQLDQRLESSWIGKLLD